MNILIEIDDFFPKSFQNLVPKREMWFNFYETIRTNQTC